MTQIVSPDGTPASRFVFGTMQWGGDATEADARTMYDACRAAGITHFDTAYVYQGGRSEEILGRLVRDERDSLVIATKVGQEGGGSRANLMAQFDACRSRLGMDAVDILYMHQFDPKTPLAETIDTLMELRAQGLFRYLGLSNFAAWQVMKARMLGAEVAILQPMYNLVKRQAEVEILPMCAAEGIVCAPYSPLGGGLLTGKYARGESGRIDANQIYNKRYAPDWMKQAAADLSALAAEVGVAAPTLAVAWVARHRAQVCPIVSARRPEQLQPSLDAIGFDMDDALYARISALTPAPPPASDRLEEA